MQCARVLEAIESFGGLTRDELEVCLDMTGSTVRPRVCELIEGGWVEETSRTRTTRYGQAATVLISTGREPDAPAA